MALTKIKGIKMKAFIIILFSSILLICYFSRDIIEMYRFGEAVHTETQDRLIKHKALFKSLTFSGIIEQKVNCNECRINTFQLVLKINNKLSNESIQTNPLFHRYYFFKNEKELHLSITKEIFDSVKIGDLVIKESNSLGLKTNDFKYDLLSNEPNEWFEN